MTRARLPAWIGPRGVAAGCALAAAAGCAAFVVPWPWAVGAALAVAVAVGVADARAARSMPRIAVDVPERLALARADALRVHVTYDGPGTQVVSTLADPAARIDVDPAPLHLRVAAGERVTGAIPFVPRERGLTALGGAWAWYETSVGLLRWRVRVAAPVARRIVPDLGALERSDLAVRARQVELGMRRLRRSGSGSDVASLRPYVAGDPFRDVAWRATARRGVLTVVEREVERGAQIVLALDVGRLMAPRIGDRRKIDYAVSAALAVAALARRAGDAVGLHAFGAHTVAALPAGRGAPHVAALAALLADVEPTLDDADVEAAVAAIGRRFPKRSLIVVFTDLFDPEASTATLGALAVLARRHAVLVALMNDAAIETVLRREPRTAEDAYAAAVALTLAAERARAIAVLRGRGLLVVDVPAARLSIAALDAYVAAKTRAHI